MKRFSLTTFLLFVAAISVWVACYVLGQQVADLKTKLRPLQVVSNSLIVDDPAQIAVVRVDVSTVLRDFRWRVYLPPVSNDETFVLCMAQDSNCPAKLPSIDSGNVKQFPIQSGTHEISFIEIAESETEKAERRSEARKMVKNRLTRGTGVAGGGAVRMRTRNPVYELKVDGEPLGDFQHQLRNSTDWELLFDSSSVQQSAEQPFVLSPTSWKPKYELYLWIQKVKR